MPRLRHIILIMSVMQCLLAYEDVPGMSNQRNRGNLASTNHPNPVDTTGHSHSSVAVDHSQHGRFRDEHTTIRNYIDTTLSNSNRYLNLSAEQALKNNNKRKSVEYDDDESRMVYPSEMAQIATQCSYGLCDEVDEYPFEKIQRILNRSELKKFFSSETVQIGTRFGDNFDNLCATITHTRFPKTAKNLNNVEQVIVNVDQYKQGIIFETCKSEGPCNFAENFPNNFTPECVQKYTVRKLMVVGKETDNAVFDDFKIPSCCVCMVKK